ncbi:DUF2802 domain-containing protein [Candidatus Accumulibacter sp. ACC003]|uniref:DUF2802 domain-containing protein n=1 Tax=Candidatus Accumulibacter sp. ACC003 TaxID=2823334 RepID=UPI0025C2B069|nr:DUF2802 domain-containing protein [Candidatus Accumulibacter sp. ACC003]
MDLELLGGLGWREVLIAVIALLVGYIVVIFLRMRRLQRELRGAALPPLAAQSALAAYSGIQQSATEVAAVPAVAVAESPAAANAVVDEPVALAESPVPVDSGAADFPWNEPPPEIPGQALIDMLQVDVDQLRCEIEQLRDDLHRAREDFRQQLAQFSGSPQAASPLYNDAMQMAAQGQDASTIAQHCGIARAEADLVVALARNRNDGP